jgi:hypothetical protein
LIIDQMPASTPFLTGGSLFSGVTGSLFGSKSKY